MPAQVARSATHCLVYAVAIAIAAMRSTEVHAQVLAHQPGLAERGDCRAAAPKQHAALTVEGGGTLGTYEGGFTWALVEIFRQRRLMGSNRAPRDTSLDHVLRCLPLFDLHAAAGASAGSINAFIAANEWCSVGPFQSDEESAFWRVWVTTGLSDLLPRKRDLEWKTETGLFTRTRFGELFAALDDGWNRAEYGDEACSVAFGAAVTRLADDSLAVSDQVHARNQRYAAAFRVYTAPHTPGGQRWGPFYLRPPPGLNERLRLGSLVELPVGATGLIKHEFAHALIKASSGYPLAFEPHPVRYCPQLQIPMARIRGTAMCDEKAARTSYFVDGGVFDNGPLTLSYALALADPSRIALDNLYMLYINPNQRRATGNRRDLYIGGPKPSSKASGTDTLGGAKPADNALADDEQQFEGLDAVAKLFATFIPSARQYELQIAARFLPTVQDADLRLSLDSARLYRAETNLSRLRQAVDSEYTLRKNTLNTARLARDTLAFVRDSLRYALAQCRLQAQPCARLPEDSTTLPPLLRGSPDSTPPKVLIDTNYVRSISARRQFDSLLYVSQRWHPLGGDWLFGFGGFIGRPLREYDFYVGEYDALAFVALHMLCVKAADAFCQARQLASLISDEGLPLTPKARAILRFLYDQEFSLYPGLPKLSSTADSTTYPVLVSIVKAMGVKMGEGRLPSKECAEGGPVERLSCLEGMDTVFATLRADHDILHRLGKANSDCSKLERDKHRCRADTRFQDFVGSPHPALNRLAGEVLERVSETTPGESGLKFPLTIVHAMYLATNERARQRVDAGSVSLPTLTGGWTLFYLLPSSIGGFGGIQGWYAEWALRRHFNQSLALGIAPRVVWRSGLYRSSAVRRGQAFVPAIRLEYKMPSRFGAPWVSTLGADVAWWNDWSIHQFGKGSDVSGLTPAVTASLLAQRVRVSVYKKPDKYYIRSGDKPYAIVSIGFGDTNGVLYWLARILAD